MSFKCDSCGICCRNINGIKQLETYHSGDGVCKHLVGNRCSIYNCRPTVCRVERLYYQLNTNMTIEEWYDLNHKACEKLKGLENG